MLEIAKLREDIMGQFHNSLYLGNIATRIHILEQAGHIKLALATAITHSLSDETERLTSLLSNDEQEQVVIKDQIIQQIQFMNKNEKNGSSLFIPPIPILKEKNWPLLDIGKGFFDEFKS